MFTDAEAWLCAYLNSHGIEAATLTPPTGLTRWVRVRRVGGSLPAPGIDAALMALDISDLTGPKATALTSQVGTVLAAAPGKELLPGTCVGIKHLSGPVSLPDPDTAKPSYRMTYEIKLRSNNQ